MPRHIRSSQNVVADSLTRMYESQLTKREVSPEQSERVPVMPILSDFPGIFVNIKEYQSKDPLLASIINKLSSGDVFPPYSLRNGVLCCTAKYDSKAKVVVFSYFHDSVMGGHLGIYKTRHKIREQLIWKGMIKTLAHV